MLRAIFGREIRVGDTIRVDEGLEGKVLEYLFTDSGGRCFKLDCGQLRFLDRTIVGLVRRPRPKGKTETDMLVSVNEAIRQATVRVGMERPFIEKESLPHIRELIENWELGRE